MIRNMMERFQRELNNPMKEIRSMETDMGALDENSIRKNWFREEVEVKDDDEDSYADITIPDFRDGRSGRFIHDYKNNQTTIVDGNARRCFIYPLDYETTAPPSSIVDVFFKMQSGYYLPDTNVLRKKMRVVIPELSKDDDSISTRTASLCNNMHIYRLESFVSGVYKRSVDDSDSEALFAEFAGKGIFELDIVNLKEIKQLEKSSQ